MRDTLYMFISFADTCGRQFQFEIRGVFFIFSLIYLINYYVSITEKKTQVTESRENVLGKAKGRPQEWMDGRWTVGNQQGWFICCLLQLFNKCIFIPRENVSLLYSNVFVSDHHGFCFGIQTYSCPLRTSKQLPSRSERLDLRTERSCRGTTTNHRPLGDCMFCENQIQVNQRR